MSARKVRTVKSLSPEARLDVALRHYMEKESGPYRDGRPAQPSRMRCSVEDDGTVTLRNSFNVLAKMRVSDKGEIEELDFDPYENPAKAAIVERLKAAHEQDAQKDYEQGKRAGQRWAENTATPKQLRRLAEYIEESDQDPFHWSDVDYHGWNAPWGATGYFALAIMALDPAETERSAVEDFWETALGGNVARLDDADFFRGFGEGAAALWEELEDEL